MTELAKDLKDLGEDELIRTISGKSRRRHPRILKAIGDDTSVSVQKGGRALLATTDILIEDTHFRLSYTPAYYLGKKSLSISVSDIAAMGGSPLFFLVSMAMPPTTPKIFIDGLYRGIRASARLYGVALAGGNTARSGKVMVSTTVIGEAEPEKVVYRSGARPGDIVYVTGSPGESGLGLLLLNARGPGAPAMRKGFKKAVMRHLDPAARLPAARAIASKRLASAMIDVSDGVALDLKRLCRESKAGAEVRIEALPVSETLKRYQRLTGKDIHGMTLSGGEDYELLFTAPEANSGRIKAVSRSLGLRITPIGRITERKKGFRIIDEKGNEVRLKSAGFEHFRGRG